MRTVVVLAVCLALTGCGRENSDIGAPEDVMAPVMAADGAPPEGRYRAVSEDGSVLIEELHEDGTYSFLDEEGALLEEGSYMQESSERLCFTANAQSAATKCYAEEIGEDGIWRTTDTDTGETSVVERIDDQ